MLAIVLGTVCLLAATPPPGGGAQATPDSVAEADSSATEGAEADSAAAEPDTTHVSGAQARPAPAPADTSVRIPGTRLRFGFTPERVAQYGEFPIAKVAGKPHEVARRGPATWFGIEGEATLFFRSGHLMRAELKASKVARHSIDYLQDELARQGYRRACETSTPAQEVCTWHGRTVVKLTTGNGEFNATVEPAPKPRPAPVAAAPPPAPAFVPERDVFVLGRPGVVNAFPDPEFEVRPDPRAVYPKAARTAGVQGNVWIRASVDSAGAIASSKIVKGIPLLDSAAVAVVKGTRFRPYAVAGKPTRFEVEFPVRFLLH